MSALAINAFIDGVGLLGPGMASFEDGTQLFAGGRPWTHAPTAAPPPEGLPAAERRRSGMVIRIALAAGREALRQAAADATTLASVFASSGGDGENCHEMCVALAASERQLSPTRFHNSVHNAPAGYWGIATGSTAAANALCAHDASFAAGLIEALTQVAAERRAVLLVVYDAPYPEPLRPWRPIPDAFATALLLSPGAGPATLARIEAHLSDEPATTLAEPLESLRRAIPAARALPLLAHLAQRTPGTVVLDYLEPKRLAVAVRPCR